MLEILVCPICKGKLEHDRTAHELICNADKMAFPVRDGIPVMLIEQARDLHAPTTDAAPSAPRPPADDSTHNTSQSA